MSDTNDEIELVRRSLEGDAAAFETLVRRYQTMIDALAYRMTGTSADAEDVAQETFIRAYRKLRSYRHESKFSSWLYRIAINVSLNWNKSRKRRLQLHEEWLANHAGAVGGDDDRIELVQACLLRLTAKQRAAIVLTVYEGQNHAEAAHAMGCAEITVSWHVHRARQRLKEWLAPHLKSESQGADAGGSSAKISRARATE
jgi:RNA polymerase sigma-70 factor (ECF subfamily)